MGFNSVLFVCNDAWGAIEDDPKAFWDNARHALHHCYDGPQDFRIGHHVNGGQAVWMQHADCVALLTVGGNTSQVVGSTSNGGRHRGEEDMIAVMKEILQRRGYNVVKMPNRESPDDG